MKEQIDIREELPNLSDKDIQKHMDFDQLMTGQTQVKEVDPGRPWGKWMGFVVGVAAVVLGAYLVWTKVMAPTHMEYEGETFLTEEYYHEEVAYTVSPPLTGLETPYSFRDITPGESTKLVYETGSILEIPGNAFVFADGSMVDGVVSIAFREFHDQAEIFTSGIPMAYDSAGGAFFFESAGMCDIRAFVGEEEVFLNESSEIAVSLASNTRDPDFNLYLFDEENGKWVQDGTQKVEEAGAGSAPADSTWGWHELEYEDTTQGTSAIVALQEELTELTEPVEPKLADDNLYKFNIEASKEEYPELAIYEEFTFEVPEDQPFDPDWYDVVFTDITLELQGEGRYLVTVYTSQIERSFEVYPVFEEGDYEDATKVFEQKQQEYEKLKKEKEEAIAAERERIAKEIERNNMLAQQRRTQLAAQTTSSLILRTFSISQTGIWNCDRPQAWPKGNTVSTLYVTADGMDVQSTIYLYDSKKNAQFVIDNRNREKLTFDPKADNCMWTVLPSNEVAYVDAEHFAEEVKNGGDVTIEFTTWDGPLKSEVDVEELFDEILVP